MKTFFVEIRLDSSDVIPTEVLAALQLDAVKHDGTFRNYYGRVGWVSDDAFGSTSYSTWNRKTTLEFRFNDGMTPTQRIADVARVMAEFHNKSPNVHIEALAAHTKGVKTTKVERITFVRSVNAQYEHLLERKAAGAVVPVQKGTGPKPKLESDPTPPRRVECVYVTLEVDGEPITNCAVFTNGPEIMHQIGRNVNGYITLRITAVDEVPTCKG